MKMKALIYTFLLLLPLKLIIASEPTIKNSSPWSFVTKGKVTKKEIPDSTILNRLYYYYPTKEEKICISSNLGNLNYLLRKETSEIQDINSFIVNSLPTIVRETFETIPTEILKIKQRYKPYEKSIIESTYMFRDYDNRYSYEGMEEFVELIKKNLEESGLTQGKNHWTLTFITKNKCDQIERWDVTGFKDTLVIKSIKRTLLHNSEIRIPIPDFGNLLNTKPNIRLQFPSYKHCPVMLSLHSFSLGKCPA